MMRGKPGFEHLNEPLHILVEAELPAEIIDSRLMQAREILEELLRPVVDSCPHNYLILVYFSFPVLHLFFLLLCIQSRMNLRTFSRNSNSGSLRWSMVLCVTKVHICQGLCRPSTTAWVWRGQKQGARGSGSANPRWSLGPVVWKLVVDSASTICVMSTGESQLSVEHW